jgi:hypothetical protein
MIQNLLLKNNIFNNTFNNIFLVCSLWNLGMISREYGMMERNFVEERTRWQGG